jgi:periplasmic protein TonB
MKPDPILRLPFLILGLPLAVAACRSEPVVETEPVALTQPAFEYPEELWDAGVQGCTVLRLRVNAEGSVDSALVERSSGYPPFDSAALAGMDELRFDPARRDGTPVTKWVLLPVEFPLSDGATPCADPEPTATP